MEEFTMDEDATDSLKLTVTEEIHKTLVDFPSDTVGEKCNSTEKIIEKIVEIVIIDEEDYDENTGAPDKYRLAEIWYNIKPLTSIRNTKHNIAKALSVFNIDPESLNDFDLGSMGTVHDDFSASSVSEDSIHDILKRSVPVYYLATLLLDYIYEHSVIPETKNMLKCQHQSLLNACIVIENALKVNGWLAPDLEPTRTRFDEFEARLAGLADEYLKSVPEDRFESARGKESGLEVLRQNKQLVINYEIVSEVEYAVSDLRDVFGTIMAKVLGEGGDGSLGRHAEVSERSAAIWEFPVDKSGTREHYA